MHHPHMNPMDRAADETRAFIERMIAASGMSAERAAVLRAEAEQTIVDCDSASTRVNAFFDQIRAFTAPLENAEGVIPGDPFDGWTADDGAALLFETAAQTGDRLFFEAVTRATAGGNLRALATLALCLVSVGWIAGQLHRAGPPAATDEVTPCDQ